MDHARVQEAALRWGHDKSLEVLDAHLKDGNDLSFDTWAEIFKSPERTATVAGEGDAVALAQMRPEDVYKLQPVRFQTKELGPQDARIEICYAGVCRTDLELLHNAWSSLKPPGYPFTPGHECTGVITKVGPEVPAGALVVGDKVALSHVLSNCGNCEFCRAGLDPHCKQVRPTACVTLWVS